jgi:2-C-methyl-D-erythritol 2,4-cyclodiphosphate synthase
MQRIGFGSDVHKLMPGLPLMIGGVRVESDLGAEGHSDADVLTHAITDAILGAIAMGDIGTHFPNSDERWRNAESFVFLRYAVGLMKEHGYTVANLDSTVHLELPRLRPYIDEIRKGIADALEVETNCVSVKAKTGEGVDSVGERRSIKAEAVIMLERSDE